MVRNWLFSMVVVLAGAQAIPAEEPVLLQYKYKKGDKPIYKSTDTLEQTQTIMGQKLENKMTHVAYATRLVDAIDDQGTAVIKVRVERRKVVAEFTGAGKFEFDSASTERDNGSLLGAALTPLFERLTGSDYEVHITPTGKVNEVKGFAELIGDLKDNPIANQFGAGRDNKSAAVSEQQFLTILSDKPVKPGDTWEEPFEVDLDGVGKIKGKTTAKFEAYDKVGDRKTARIGTTSELTVEINTTQGGAKVTGTMTANNATGTMQFDIEAGRPISIKETAALSGQLSVDVNGMTILIDQSQSMVHELELLDKLP